MNVLITGATGFLGSWVARALSERGHRVVALVRANSKLDNLADLPLERRTGDVLDAASIAAALDGCDAVMHVAGVAHFQAGETERMYAVNIEGVRNVLAAAQAAGVKRVVVTSSLGALGGAKTPRVADDTTPSNAEALGIDYLISKHRGEQVALEFARAGLDVCVTRPAVLLGPGDIYNSSAHTFRAIASRKLPVYVPGGASFTDVRDVAFSHVIALERGARGETYLLAGHNLPIREMVERVARTAGVRPPRAMPYALALGVAAVAESTAKLLRRHTDLSRQLVKASALFTFASSDKAIRTLEYRIRPFEESLRDTLRFFLANGRLRATTPELRALAGQGDKAPRA